MHVLAIDIAGAFDKVSHAGLLLKASVYGLDGALHGWLSDYLTGRSSILCSAAQLQTAVNAVAQWGDTWKIRFEPSKCQALTVDHHRPRNLPPIIFNGKSVAEESEIKLLGVIFDKQLLFSKHLQAVATKANQHLHKAAPLLGSSGRATVYKAFARPIMEYCCLPWIGTPSACLDRVQRKALHIIGHGAWLPSLQHRRTVAGLTFLYKLHCLRKQQPTQDPSASPGYDPAGSTPPHSPVVCSCKVPTLHPI